MPEDNPSKPSIKLIALVIPTIHPIVNMYTNISLDFNILSINSIFVSSILIPKETTMEAAIICPINFTMAATFTSSI